MTAAAGEQQVWLTSAQEHFQVRWHLKPDFWKHTHHHTETLVLFLRYINKIGIKLKQENRRLGEEPKQKHNTRKQRPGRAVRTGRRWQNLIQSWPKFKTAWILHGWIFTSFQVELQHVKKKKRDQTCSLLKTTLQLTQAVVPVGNISSW